MMVEKQGELNHTPKRGGLVEQAFNSVDAEIMRQAMRRWATGVSVVTTRQGTVRHGMTVSSFISISLAPPLLMVSLQDTSRTCRLVEQSNVFGVMILDQRQQDLSDRFAGRISDDDDRFDGLETYTLTTGAPFPLGGIASFDCRVVIAYKIGGHTLFVGDVVALQVGREEKPLLYYERKYWQLLEAEKPH
jgi:flavin reductase (DIM6/NTAB) family NADH-FMN oxidoreductase RutF